jgi:DNA polymerase-3 subunit epsilon
VAPPGTALAEVTFVVLDLETTGGSPALDRITEIGALKFRGGELLGRFETLVNPGAPIPPTITVLTGISEAMVVPAPMIGELLPTILEFLGDAVIVGHNVRFDCGFLDAALVEHGYEPLPNWRVDTFGIARRLVRDDVPNLRLHTLAQHFRTETVPVHRAYADAAATAELFHSLLEQAGTWGVLGLDDLIALPRLRLHPSMGKLALTARLPRGRGVYVCRDRRGTVVYVGKAANLRTRVRAYFSSQDGRQPSPIVRETACIEHVECATALEAAVRELRLVARLRPRHNRPTRARRTNVYLKVTHGKAARIAIVRRVDEGDDSLGPFSSFGSARLARDAAEEALPELARGSDAPAETREIAVKRARLAFAGRPRLLLDRVVPGEARDALDRALRRSIVVRALARVEHVVVTGADGPIELRHGRLVLGDDDDRDLPAHVVHDEILVVARALSRRR